MNHYTDNDPAGGFGLLLIAAALLLLGLAMAGLRWWLA